jgi:hypothetical protein
MGAMRRVDFTGEPSTGRIQLTGHVPTVSASVTVTPDHALLDRILTYLEFAREAHLAGDRDRVLRHINQVTRIIKGIRAVGRPRKPRGQKKPERVARYCTEYGIEATIEQFPELKYGTIEKYVGKKCR